MLALAGARPVGGPAGVADVAVVAAPGRGAREQAGVDQRDGLGDQAAQPPAGGLLVVRQRQLLEPAAARDEPVQAGDLSVVRVAGLPHGQLIDGQLHAQPVLEALRLGGAVARLVVDDAGARGGSVDAVEAAGEADRPPTRQLEADGPAGRLAEAPLDVHRPVAGRGEHGIAAHGLEQVLEQHGATHVPRERGAGDAAPLGLGAGRLPRRGEGVQRLVETETRRRSRCCRRPAGSCGPGCRTRGRPSRGSRRAPRERRGRGRRAAGRRRGSPRSARGAWDDISAANGCRAASAARASPPSRPSHAPGSVLARGAPLRQTTLRRAWSPSTAPRYFCAAGAAPRAESARSAAVSCSLRVQPHEHRRRTRDGAGRRAPTRSDATPRPAACRV